MSLTKQKNYVHAQQNSIKGEEKSNYTQKIKEHRNELMNLIKNIGDENFAKTTQEKLNKQVEDIKSRKQALAAYLNQPENMDIYSKFVESTLIDFTKEIVIKQDTNLYKYNEKTSSLNINPDAVPTTSTGGVKNITPTEFRHYLKTINDRLTNLEKTLQDLKGQTNNSAAQEIVNAVKYRLDFLKKIYNNIPPETKIVKRGELVDILNYKLDLFNFFEKGIAKLTRFFQNTEIIFRLQKRLSEQVAQDIFDHLDNLSEKITTESIEAAISKSAAANEKVKVSAELEYGAIGKLHGPTASQDEYKSITKKIGGSGKYNDFYIDFGKKEVDNKIDYYITINNKQVGISHKSYNLASNSKKKEYQNISFASTLNLLSLILGMNSIDKSYAFLNTIAPDGKNQYREIALDTLKRQAIYAGLTGHLGGRQLLNGKDKAEYLVVEDSSNGKYYIYAMSTIMSNDKYIEIEPDNPSPFTKNGYRTYFENSYVKSQSGKPNWVAAWQRNTLLLLKLRQTKLHISLDKSHIKNGDIRLMDKSN